MTLGEIIDYLHGYEVREARANHRARMIMTALNGEDLTDNWPLPAIDEQPKGQDDFLDFMKTITHGR